MPAPFFRVNEGPLVHNGVVVVPAGKWGVLELATLPDPDDESTPLELGVVRFVCGTEQEAERKARELIFGPELARPPADVLDSLPDGEPDDDWDFVPLDEEDDSEEDDKEDDDE